MRLPALILLILPACFPAGAAAQASLNKCIDAAGRVTYSNLPCRGAHEVQKVEIDPPPPRPAPVPASTPAPQPATPPVVSAPVAPAPPPATPVVQPPPRPSAPAPAATPPTRTPPQPAAPRAAQPATAMTPRSCDTLSEQLGHVLDKMDAARSKGATPQQLDAWTQEIQDLERKKREASCF